MAKKMRVDFGGVDKEIRRGGKAARLPEGDYLFKIVKHEVRKTKDGTGKYISWQLQCVSTKYKGKTIYHITSLKPDALWNLRNLIHAATGKNVAGRAVEFDPASMYGKIIAGTTEDNEYTTTDDNSKEKTSITSRLADLRPKSELGDEEADDEDEEDDDESEETDEEDDGEDDEDSDDDGDDDEDEDEEDDDEDDEGDEKPAAKKKSGASKSSGGKVKDKKKRKDDDEEDLEDVDLDDI